MKAWPMAIPIIIIGLLDSISTYMGINQGLGEANPWVAYLFSNIGLLQGVMIQFFLVTGGLSLVAVGLTKTYLPAGFGVIMLHAYMAVPIVINNFELLGWLA